MFLAKSLEESWTRAPSLTQSLAHSLRLFITMAEVFSCSFYHYLFPGLSQHPNSHSPIFVTCYQMPGCHLQIPQSWGWALLYNIFGNSGFLFGLSFFPDWFLRIKNPSCAAWWILIPLQCSKLQISSAVVFFLTLFLVSFSIKMSKVSSWINFCFQGLLSLGCFNYKKMRT